MSILPLEIISKIMLYNIHPIAEIIKLNIIHSLIRQVMGSYITKIELEFPLKKQDLDCFFNILFKHDYYPYYIKFHNQIGMYGTFEILDYD